MNTDKQSYEQILSGNEQAGHFDGPVNCLGRVFNTDAARRDYYIGELEKKLKDPEFRKIEGFPVGKDEDILALSDPPYYTICPNPWLDDFITFWKSNNCAQGSTSYKRDPFVANVSEGKSDPIYNSHLYPTKVPPKAIMQFLMHYTEPGDIVFDGFCGTGMLGVAAQRCANPDDETRLAIEKNVDNVKWGMRYSVLTDLSPIATFITNNQNRPPLVSEFLYNLNAVIDDVKSSYEYLFKGKNPATGSVSEIYHVVWSEVFTCSSCSHEMVFWESGVNHVTGEIREEMTCGACGSVQTKSKLDRKYVTIYHKPTKQAIKQSCFVPVAIKFSTRGDRSEYPITEEEISKIEATERMEIPFWHPTTSINENIDLWYERDYTSLGIFSVDSFYTARNLLCISALFDRAKRISSVSARNAVIFGLTGMSVNLSKMNRWRYDVSFPYNPLSGTLYVGSLPVESNVFHGIANKGRRLAGIWGAADRNSDVVAISTQSAENVKTIPDNSIDYIFTDPPFGSNFIYSDLNLICESWLNIFTNTDKEAVVHRRKKNGNTIDDYRNVMLACFREYHRVLKPGRWITIVFSNTKAAVWNSLQTAMSESGFIVANVSALDKQQGSFKAITTPTAVKQDLVISAYKPNGGFEDRFENDSSSEERVWDFVRTHLSYLPISKKVGTSLQMILERDARILFDKMVSYYVRRGLPIPISSVEFQNGLSHRFIERDGMYFLPEQAAKYDIDKLAVDDLVQESLFISDEASAIQWLRQTLTIKPQTAQDLNPLFMQQLGGWSKNEQQLDLRELLAQNFLIYEGDGPVPEQIHSYLSSNWKEMRNLSKNDPGLIVKAQNRWYAPDPNKIGDLEKIRERALLKEFAQYVLSSKKLKIFRIEAVRAGFKKAWQDRDYSTIISVAQKIPESVLQEDPKLLMWYDQAVTRAGQG